MQRLTVVVLSVIGLVACAAGKGARQSGETPLPLGPLLVSATAEPDRGDAPLRVRFEAEVYEGDAAVDPRFEWDFGDGSKKRRGDRVEHTFQRPGEYTVTVQVRDATGRQGRDELIVSVEPLFGK